MAFATLGTLNPQISTQPAPNPYETDKLLHEYLLFHYGTPEEVLPYAFGPRDALDYPVRCAHECAAGADGRDQARALDLGCAVGRSSFELARFCREVVGIDYSHRFVAAAEQIRTTGGMDYLRADEGVCGTPLRAGLPAGVDPGRVRFEQGDAMELRGDLGAFDVVLLANLIDRLHEPARCLNRLPELVAQDGLLVVTSPYTWMEEYTPATHWLGGLPGDPSSRSTLEGLRRHLEPAFRLESTKDLPFLIREHARKFQWSVAQASVWRRLPHSG
jgi:putative 4-mercaptohistidine N1-methyltranferase